MDRSSSALAKLAEEDRLFSLEITLSLHRTVYL
jgi:hypothetical protein